MINATIVFFCQILFLYFRTINVWYTSRDKVWPTVISSIAVGALWLVTTMMGVTALLDIENEYPVIVGHLLGGAIGTYLGMKIKFK